MPPSKVDGSGPLEVEVTGSGVSLRRRASEVAKPSCPYCGCNTSSVYQTYPARADDALPRRRQCTDCGRPFPTMEVLDLDRLERDLAVDGLTLAHLGLSRVGSE